MKPVRAQVLAGRDERSAFWIRSAAGSPATVRCSRGCRAARSCCLAGAGHCGSCVQGRIGAGASNCRARTYRSGVEQAGRGHRARRGRSARPGRRCGSAPIRCHSQPPVGVEVAAGPAGVVGVQAVRHVEVAARERDDQRPAEVVVERRAPPSTERPGLARRSRCPAIRGAVGDSRAPRPRPRLQGGDVLRDGRDPVRLGGGLHDQPAGAGRARPAAPTRRAAAARRPGCAGRRPCRCRSRRASPGVRARTRPPAGAAPATASSSWSGVGLLGVAERDAAHAVLPEEHALQHAQRDQQRRRAQLAHHAAAERLQVRLAPVPAAASSSQQLPPVRPPRSASGVRLYGRQYDTGPPSVACRPRPAERPDDPARVGRAVPDLDRESGPGHAVEQRPASWPRRGRRSGSR